MFFAAALHAILARFGEDEGTVQTIVNLVDNGTGKVEQPLVCVRRAARGMFYADEGNFSIGRWAC